MIGSLRGKVIYKGLDRVEVDTGGIGWEVIVTQNDLIKIELEQELELSTYHHIAEDRNELFGFLDRQDKRMFEMLISVSGIGPKTAMNIFSAGNGQRIIRAVSEADVQFFLQVKGLGQKGAQRVIVDLKSKVGGIRDLDLEKDAGANETAYQALLALGFRKEEISKALRNVPFEMVRDEEKIKFALKQLGK